ncbi:MAG: D-alanyl-D-alanine carboxypeptidase [Candidatus Pacebacteria bacterium]|nr:D-alanyl-D-alanine carboxypeptidase [Candidatus Paceibacterota bacterium]
MDRKIEGLTIVVAILVLANAYFFITIYRNPEDSLKIMGKNEQAFILPPNPVSYLPIRDTSAQEVNLDAKSAILYDVKSDRNLFEKNIKDKLPIASLTKVLNAVVVWEKFSPNDLVRVGASAVKVDGERKDLFVNETISVHNLMQMMLIESSNDAAYALRDFAASRSIDLVAEMNKKASELGMNSTHFVDPAGLDDTGYSTVSDLVKGVVYALRYDAIWSFSRQSSATIVSADGKITREIKSTDQLLGVLSDIVGGKTGYTDSALGCMILIVDAPNQSDSIIAIVLGSHDRFGDMKNLVSWAKTAYRWN